MKLLNISAGGTKIVGEYGAITALLSLGFKPDIISGVSAGAVLGLFVAMDKLNDVHNKMLTLKTSDFFKSPPVNEKGKITLSAMWRLVTGRKSLGDFSNIVKLMSQYITEEEFDRWRYSSESPQLYVTTVSFTTGERINWKINDLSYKKALNVIRASASIPVFTDPVKLRHQDGTYHYHFDGGTRDFVGGAHIIEKYRSDITQVINIYAKPLDNKIFEFDHGRTKSMLSIFMATLGVLQTEISKSDEDIINLLASTYNIRSTNYHLPNVLAHPYDTDPKRLSELYVAGKRMILDTYVNR